jgi:archaellum component FlaC
MAEQCAHHNDTIQKVGEFAARLNNLEKQIDNLAASSSTSSHLEVRNQTEIEHLKDEFAELKGFYDLNHDLIENCQTVACDLANKFEVLDKKVQDVTKLYDAKVNVTDFSTYKANMEKDFGIIKERLAEKATKDSMESWKWVIVAIGCGIIGAAAKSLF